MLLTVVLASGARGGVLVRSEREACVDLYRGPRMILKPRGAGAQVATHSHLPRVWREAGMEGRKRS
jgi:hypothetical protein